MSEKKGKTILKILRRILELTPITFILDSSKVVPVARKGGVSVNFGETGAGTETITAKVRENPTKKDRINWFINGIFIVGEGLLMIGLEFYEVLGIPIVILGLVSMVGSFFPKIDFNKSIFSKNIFKKDEYLDLVDENDKVIGKKLRSEIYKEGLKNYRAVNAFIINSEGKIWVPRRVASKRIFPSCLDMSLAEHMLSGETYEEAFERGLKEELNIDLKGINYKFLRHLSSHKDGVSCFMKVYEIKSDKAPRYNKEDFTGYRWLAPKEILKEIVEGEKTKEDLPRLIKILYSDKL